ncbi:MAG: sensor histidine kinase [Pseudomonadota bacterium]
MPDWIAVLRAQVAAIAAGQYADVTANCAHAPDELTELCGDLERLAEILAERDKVRASLALEVHHRVKNNLQIVASLLSLQAGRSDSPAVQEALVQTRERIEALALVQRAIYVQANDGGQPSLDVANLIQELCGQFRRTHSGRSEVAFSCKSASLLVPLDSALPLALFAVEAVTNAYAYAFPDRRTGSIRLRFTVSKAGLARLSVVDDGIGFATDGSARTTGRLLMGGFADQLQGRFKITSRPSGGTTAQLDYPVG